MAKPPLAYKKVDGGDIDYKKEDGPDPKVEQILRNASSNSHRMLAMTNP
jgi:hypothetical protein